MDDPASVDAEEPDGRLLVCIKKTRGAGETAKVWIAGYQPAVVAPVETDPGQSFPRLILKMGCLIERLIVVDTEHFSTRDGGAQPADLWREIARPNVSKDGQCREAVEIRHADADRGPVNLRAFPGNGEEDRRVAERGEVIRVVRVLPQVVGVHHHVLSKSLLKAGIELVALAGANRRLQARAADNVGDNRISRSQACQNQVLIERRLQHA